jgi:hypothetical protein
MCVHTFIATQPQPMMEKQTMSETQPSDVSADSSPESAAPKTDMPSPANDGPFREKVVVELPVVLTDEEKLGRTEEYFDVMSTIDEKREALKDLVASKKQEIKSLEVRAAKLRAAVRVGRADMTVNAEQVYDHREGQTWTEFDGVRYRERRMTSQEYLKGQPELFPDSTPTPINPATLRDAARNGVRDPEDGQDDDDENELGRRVATSEEGKVTRLDKRRASARGGSEDEAPLSDKDREIRAAMREERSTKTKKDYTA